MLKEDWPPVDWTYYFVHCNHFREKRDVSVLYIQGGPTLIKNKIKFSSYIRKFRGIGCKVIYD
jgi:hypothetical protein